MSDTTAGTGQELRSLTAEIVAAYVRNNSIHLGDLAGVISSVHGSLSGLGEPKPEPVPDALVPPVSIKKSITPDYLISLEDGKPYRSLKRHLAGRGLTPEQYRAKWGLKPDYPMTAPAYSARRSELARALGLGRKREEPPARPAPVKLRSRKPQG